MISKQIKENCKVEIKQFQEKDVFILTPNDKEKSEEYILYFHGGSYMANLSEKHLEFLQQLVEDTKSTIIIPDYPLTPKYNYKDVFQMVVPLYNELIKQVTPEQLILMGDSAGGGLTLALEENLVQTAKSEGTEVKLPKKTILISPWLDVRLTNPEIDEVQKNDKELNKNTLKIAGAVYAAEDGIDSYLVNPIDGDMSNLKNITIFTGTYDILNPDVKKLQERAKEVGTLIDVKEYKEAAHIWIIEKNSSEDLIKRGYQELLNQIKEGNAIINE